jgi:DNA-binding Lrp family transcriptional regulator
MSLVTEKDLELVDAVQINPRASWGTVGNAIGLSAVSARRRWARLAASGTAWTGSTLGPELFRGGFLEIICRPGTVGGVAAALCELPQVITVGRSIGDFDLYAITVAATDVAVDRALLAEVAALGVDRLRAQMYTRVHGGPDWRLSVLNRAQSLLVRQDGRRLAQEATVPEEGRRLFAALFGDARRSYVELADELGSSPQVVRRRLALMQARGQINLRADIARPLAGYPLAGLLWIAAPDDVVGDAGRWLAGRAENRFCAEVLAAANLVVVLDLRLPEHLAEFVARFSAEFPAAQVVDRRAVVTLLKVHGRILDDQGRSVRTVAVDPWRGFGAGAGSDAPKAAARPGLADSRRGYFRAMTNPAIRSQPTGDVDIAVPDDEEQTSPSGQSEPEPSVDPANLDHPEELMGE